MRRAQSFNDQQKAHFARKRAEELSSAAGQFFDDPKDRESSGRFKQLYKKLFGLMHKKVYEMVFNELETLGRGQDLLQSRVVKFAIGFVLTYFIKQYISGMDLFSQEELLMLCEIKNLSACKISSLDIATSQVKNVVMVVLTAPYGISKLMCASAQSTVMGIFSSIGSKTAKDAFYALISPLFPALS